MMIMTSKLKITFYATTLQLLKFKSIVSGKVFFEFRLIYIYFIAIHFDGAILSEPEIGPYWNGRFSFCT